LGTLGGTTSTAISINNNGTIVGSAYNTFGSEHATLFDSIGAGNNIDLDPFGGNRSLAFSINIHKGNKSFKSILFPAPVGSKSVAWVRPTSFMLVKPTICPLWGIRQLDFILD
jgi:hypothetical protein